MTRLEIMQALSPRFDYAAYTAVCGAHNFEPQPIGVWAQLMGTLSAAETLYPNLPIDEAYKEFRVLASAEQEKHNQVQVERVVQAGVTPNAVPSGCSSCGGGKVR